MTPAPEQSRVVIYEVAGLDSARKVAAELMVLEGAYQKAFKRKLPLEVYVSSWGAKERPIHGLTAYYDASQRSDVEWLITHVATSITESRSGVT